MPAECGEQMFSGRQVRRAPQTSDPVPAPGGWLLDPELIGEMEAASENEVRVPVASPSMLP